MMALKGSFTHTGKQDSPALFSTALLSTILRRPSFFFSCGCSANLFFFQGFLYPALPKAFQGFPQIRPWSLALETHTQFVNTWKFGHLELGLILIFWSPFSFGLVVLPVSQMAINFGFLVVFYVSFIPLRLDSSLILPALNSKMWHLGLNYSQCLKSIFSLVGIDIGVDTR